MDDVQDLIGAQILSEGYAVIDGFLTNDQVKSMKSEVVACHKDGRLQQAGLVNGKQKSVENAQYEDTKTRGDVVGWFDSDAKEWPYGKQLGSYLLKLGTMVQELGSKEFGRVPALGNITSRSKAMVACYPGGGARYVKHVDNDGKHPLCKTRLLTTLMYLNDEWQKGDGGELAIYKADDKTVLREKVEPIANRVLMFWSDWRTPHEVLPSQKTRYSVTLWMLDNTCCGTVDAAKLETHFVSLSDAEGEKTEETANDAKADDDISDALTAKDISNALTAKDAEQSNEKTDDGEPPCEGKIVNMVTSTDGESNERTDDGESNDKTDDGDEASGKISNMVTSALAEGISDGDVRYQWTKFGGPWELLVELTGEAPVCPLVDVSDAQVKVASSLGHPLICLPLSSSDVLDPSPPRWSSRRKSLTLQFRAAPQSGVGFARAKLIDEIANSGFAVEEAFLPGPEADWLREYILLRWRKKSVIAGGNEREETTISNCVLFEEDWDPAIGQLATLKQRCCEIVSTFAGEGRIPGVVGAPILKADACSVILPTGTTGFEVLDLDGALFRRKGRFMSFFISLNPFWKELASGKLHLSAKKPNANRTAHVAPLHGRAIAYLCEDCHLKIAEPSASKDLIAFAITVSVSS